MMHIHVCMFSKPAGCHKAGWRRVNQVKDTHPCTQPSGIRGGGLTLSPPLSAGTSMSADTKIAELLTELHQLIKQTQVGPIIINKPYFIHLYWIFNINYIPYRWGRIFNKAGLKLLDQIFNIKYIPYR